jgi:hypothetical protein
MTTLDFLSELHSVKDKSSSLIFQMTNSAVAPGYHITEIKAALVQSMDCGGQGNNWHETTLQLWSPNQSTEDYMSVAKFLSIYNRVSSSLPLEDLSQIRVEYGEVGQVAISYLVTSIHKTQDSVIIQLQAPGVACKGADRSFGDIPVLNEIPMLNTSMRGCCEPSQEQSKGKESACCG